MGGGEVLSHDPSLWTKTRVQLRKTAVLAAIFSVDFSDTYILVVKNSLKRQLAKILGKKYDLCE